MVKALIVGVAGPKLTADEIAFLRQHDPWGMILFARNCENAAQISALTAAFRSAVGRPSAPVLIDQEGGRVQRIKPPMAPKYPAGAYYGALYQHDADAGVEAAAIGGQLIGADLIALGIDADCCPVADVRLPSTHDVIGDRALGESVDQVTALAAAQARGLQQAGVLPIVKHCPGHGRSRCDSHHSLPVVDDVEISELRRVDFAPFRALTHLPAFMTAHLKYTALDDKDPATTSGSIIQQVIRGEIGFDGLLFSDDISMNALSGDIATRTRAAFAAGCDVVLHCNGVAEERAEAADNAPQLAGKSMARAARALASKRDPAEWDKNTAQARFAELMNAVGYAFETDLG